MNIFWEWHTNDAIEKTKCDGGPDKWPIPNEVAGKGGKPKEHKNHSFTALSQHFDKIFYGTVRIMGQIAFHILFHENAAGNDTKM
jgi:hypothetical protein